MAFGAPGGHALPFFCNGEIGPVGDRAFVHGYASVVGLFSPAKEKLDASE